MYLLYYLNCAEPKIYGPKIPTKVLQPLYRKVQRKILTYHNIFRTHVKPQAADMLAMKWHKGAANSAQKWASACRMLTHDTVKGRWVEKFGSCGQNIFISTQQVPWHYAIKTWYLEKNNFTYGSQNNSLIDVGHYTQLIWYATHRLGCGFSKCLTPAGKTYFSYVCNYCPIGNYLERLGKPYKKGEPCSGCPGHCRHGKLCTNSCPVADFWANCRDIYKMWPDWLCNTQTPQGRERTYNCKATCKCKNKIR
ncbi:hypothetical protein AAG570_001339 [Ranatra chinensis]|uniref:SCP domain-containing protein n=1 Tax=Ranatra chinensis TaxID=642074 RepID=A0ABD0YBV4_9HEMI